MSDFSSPPVAPASGHSLKPKVRLWAYVLLALALLVLGAALLWQRDVQRGEELSRQQLLAQALQFTLAAQAQVDHYAGTLLRVQGILGGPNAADESLNDLWAEAMRSTDQNHVLRPQSASQFGRDPAMARLLESAPHAEVRAIATGNKLTLVAVPANVRADSLVILMDVRFADWLRDAQAHNGQPLRVQIRAGGAGPAVTGSAPLIEWERTELTLTVSMLGQPVRFSFAQDGGAGAPWLPWVLLVLGVMVLIGGMARQQWSERALSRQALRLRDDAHKGWLHYFAITHHPQLPIVQTDADGRIEDLSPRLAQLLGYSQEAMKRLTLGSLVHPDDLDKLQTCEPLPAHSSEYVYEGQSNVRLLHSLGHFVWVDLLKVRYRPDGQERDGQVLAILLDQTQARTLQTQLQRRIEKNESILERLPVGLCIVDNQMRITFMNAHFHGSSELAGPMPETLDEWWLQLPLSPRQREDLVERWQQLLAAAIAGDGLIEAQEIFLDNVADGGAASPAAGASASASAASSSANAQPRVLEMAGIVQEDQLVLTLVDVTEHKKSEDEIRELAFYDPATGLPGRDLLLDRLQHAQRQGQSHGGFDALLLIDLERFAQLFAVHSTHFRDDLMRQVAARLQHIVPAGQTLARTDEAEFMVLLAGLGLTERACVRLCEDLGHQILDVLSAPFGHQGQIAPPDACLGAAIFQGTQHSSQELMRRVDTAALRARQGDRRQPHFYEMRIQADARARAEQEEQIRTGIIEGQFVLFFQPQMHGGEKPARLVGAEVLLRWNHAEQGLISPKNFIETAEQSDLIVPLGNWVLVQACKQLALWARRVDTRELTLSVNISARQFRQNQFVPTVLQALTSAGAPAHRLVLEISESLLLEDLEHTRAVMTQLRSYGVGFALDDFGTGYSSLSQLESLPLSGLKIDLRQLHNRPRTVGAGASVARIAHLQTRMGPEALRGAGLIHTAVALGHGLGLHVVASGIESQDQIDFLLASGCHTWQGFFVGMPQPLEELEKLIRG